ncbi:hypothetical protein SO802_005066 [Lithocarpus litseifolius]|uniref:Phytocyanin domain-containing protein n=1 Tax=Lithocarpus litseifolius TaxID=425828 RepID=A0AAW2DJU4_9ROSI
MRSAMRERWRTASGTTADSEPRTQIGDDGVGRRLSGDVGWLMMVNREPQPRSATMAWDGDSTATWAGVGREANPIGNTTTTGPANMTLDTIGNHYFICTIDSHCQSSQKLAITVLGTLGGAPPSPSTSTSAPPSTPTSSPPTTPTPTSASPRAGSRRRALRPMS